MLGPQPSRRIRSKIVSRGYVLWPSSLTYIGVGQITLRICRLDPSASFGLYKGAAGRMKIISVPDSESLWHTLWQCLANTIFGLWQIPFKFRTSNIVVEQRRRNLPIGVRTAWGRCSLGRGWSYLSEAHLYRNLDHDQESDRFKMASK